MAPADLGTSRFIPDLHVFRTTLLALDFYKDIVDDQKVEKTLTEVPNHFLDEQHYLDVLTPLYWEEVKMEIQRAKEMEMPKDCEKVQLQRFRLEGPWIRLDMLRSKEECTQRMYSQNDLVVLTQKVCPSEEEANHFLALVDTSIGTTLTMTTVAGEGERFRGVSRLISERAPWYMAKVISTQTMVREFEGLLSFPKIPLRALIVNRDDTGVGGDTATEMQAAPAPMGFKDSGKRDIDEVKMFSLPGDLEGRLKSMYNDSQLLAILDSRKVQGITLVQGPPGTGKTKTILGILTVLLNARALEVKAVSYTRTGQKRKMGVQDQDDNESDSDPGPQRKQEEEDQRRRQERMQRIRGRMPWLQGGYAHWSCVSEDEVLGPGDRELLKPYQKVRPSDIVSMSELSQDVAPKKVLVCTPSNAAVDEVLRRTGSEGLMNEEGQFRHRTIVRLGPNVHHSLNQYSLETIVKRRLLAKSEMPDLNQQEVEKEKVMREASIFFSTLSISGSRDMVGFPGDFDTVVMDEASQGLETSTLVPLKLGCQRLIMVGDPKQLPATCFSTVAQKHKYERSLFQRLQDSNIKVNMLQTQYRMHPAISFFPSHRFYEGRLLDALDAQAYETKFPAPWWSIPCFAPVVFFNLKGSQSKASASLVNDDEANFVIQLFIVLSALYPKEVWRERLAVISPYREQVQLIRRKFRALFNLPAKSPCPVEVNTVDGFQGREKDAIIVSVVRADPESRSIGFVRDQRRMNVAFTRARQNLWVVGYADVLGRNRDWKDFIDQQREKCRMLRTSRPFESWLKRYLRNWYDRHPDLERPGDDVLGTDTGAAEEEQQQEGEGGFSLTAKQLEEMEREEREQANYARPDIEEVSDDDVLEGSDSGDDANLGAAGSDNEGGGGAEMEVIKKGGGQEGEGDGGGGGGGGGEDGGRGDEG